MTNLFSNRIPTDISHSKLYQAFKRRFSRGDEALIDLTLSNPTRAKLAYPEPELIEILRSYQSVSYQPSPRGPVEARAAIADYCTQRGRITCPDDLLITSSTSESYSLLFKVLADPGRAVLVPRPSYPLFHHLLRLDGLKARTYSLHWSEGWHFDFDELESRVDSGCRALLVVNPNNPTGHYLDNAEWDRIQSFCKRHNLTLICDEVFWDFPLSDEVSPLFPNDCQVLTCFLNGLSKTAGLPQVKVAWIMARGPRASEALVRLEFAADQYLSVSTASLLATPSLLQLAPSIRALILQRIRTNYRFLCDHFKGSPISIIESEAGWSGVLRLPSLEGEHQCATRLLEEAAIWAFEGSLFGFAQTPIFVLSLLVPPRVFQAGIRGLDSTVRRAW